MDFFFKWDINDPLTVNSFGIPQPIILKKYTQIYYLYLLLPLIIIGTELAMVVDFMTDI